MPLLFFCVCCVVGPFCIYKVFCNSLTQQAVSSVTQQAAKVAPAVQQAGLQPHQKPLIQQEHISPAILSQMPQPPFYWQNRNLYSAFDSRYDAEPGNLELIQKMVSVTFNSVRTRDRARGSEMPKSLNVLKVQRIEDRNMWVRYQSAKQGLSNRRGRCVPISELSPGGQVKTSAVTVDNGLDYHLNEAYFWHGTTPEGAAGVSEDGFKLSMAGSHAGTMFGRGAYLAECSSKSDEYAHEGSSIYAGIYALVLCRAVCGQMFYTERSDIPAIERAIASGQCDSVLGDRENAVGTYREFVIFDASLIYPEFVVLYQRQY